MESIVIMVLLAIASSVFQAVVQKNKQPKEGANNAPPVKPKLQTSAKVIGKADNLGKAVPKNINSVPIQGSKRLSYNAVMAPEVLAEGTQTEALEDIVIPEQESVLESAEDSNFLQEFTINDLQRSIIMAEVLGKPKALQRPSR